MDMEVDDAPDELDRLKATSLFLRARRGVRRARVRRCAAITDGAASRRDPVEARAEGADRGARPSIPDKRTYLNRLNPSNPLRPARQAAYDAVELLLSHVWRPLRLAPSGLRRVAGQVRVGPAPRPLGCPRACALAAPAQHASVPSVYDAARALSSARHADVPGADEVVPPLSDFAPTDGSEARETGRVPMDAEPRESSGRGADGVGGDALSHSVRFVERAGGRVEKAISWVGKRRGGVGRRERWRSSGCGMSQGAGNGSLPGPYRVSGRSPQAGWRGAQKFRPDMCTLRIVCVS